MCAFLWKTNCIILFTDFSRDQQLVTNVHEIRVRIATSLHEVTSLYVSSTDLFLSSFVGNPKDFSFFFFFWLRFRVYGLSSWEHFNIDVAKTVVVSTTVNWQLFLSSNWKGIPTHQCMSYLNSICESLKKCIGRWPKTNQHGKSRVSTREASRIFVCLFSNSYTLSSTPTHE